MDMLPEGEDLNHDLLSLLEREGSEPQAPGRLHRFLEQEGNRHSQLIQLLTHLEYKEQDARRHWEAIERHRETLARELDRDPGLQVTALDYFFNVVRHLRNPKVVEMDAFMATERDAFTDSLTGLYNRLYFDTSLRRETLRARRYGLTFSLVMLDLDNFKAVNDQYGHLVGDEALAACSDVIRTSVREIDIPCRYGGEEFALILPETSRSGAYIVSERIRSDINSLSERRNIRASTIRLSISGGVAIFPVDAPSAEGLLSMADQALYRSKQEGKNQITLHAEEKRRAPRVEARKPVSLRAPDAKGRDELVSQTKNLSRGGVLFECSEPLTIGAELELSIKLQQPSRKYTLKGKVVRLKEVEPGPGKRYDIGIAFVAESEDDRRELDGLTEELYRPLHKAS